MLFTGDLNGNFLALDARDGKTLYSFDTGGPIAGGVITYEVKGKQYVAVAAGHSGGSIPLNGSARGRLRSVAHPVPRRGTGRIAMTASWYRELYRIEAVAGYRRSRCA